MNYLRLFENYVFKKRIVFKILSGTDIEINNDEVEKINLLDTNKEDILENLERFLPLARAKRYSERVENYEDWHLWISYHRKEPVGCLWALDIQYEDFKFDSFIHNKNQILICGVYVNEKARGNQLYNKMQFKAMKYLSENFPEKNVISVVEKTNVASIRSNKKYGVEVYGYNYLFKILGHNIISLFIDSLGQQNWWFLPKYKQTHI